MQRFNLNGGLILAVENSPNVSVPFHAYPNPSNGEFQLLYALDKVASCKIEIFDLEGKMVYTSATAGKSGINEYIVDGKNLAKGMYVVRLSAGSVIKNQKLVIE